MLTLYLDPVSTTSRPVALFAADTGAELTQVPVNLSQGEHLTPAFAKINPNQSVPVLDHDGFRLTESSAILKYLADLTNSPAYPADLKARARVNEWMDWFNTQFLKDFAYGCVYPQVIAHVRLSEGAELERRAWSAPRAAKKLKILDAQLAAGGPYVLGRAITLADYLGACVVTVGELADFDLSPYPHVQRWIATMKQRSAWDAVHAGFYGWRSAIQQARADAVRAAS